MRLLLCGGGSGDKTIEANKKLNEIIDHSKPILYIPLALEKNRYDGCLKWIKEELKSVDVPFIDMVYSAEEILEKNLNEYCAIFIGGGNTFKLLSELKESGAFFSVKKFIDGNGIIFGGSAGATILGYDINSCLYTDSNIVNIKDTKGFDCLNGKSLAAHYTNENREKTKRATDYLTQYSRVAGPVIAIPEEITIFVDGEKIEFIGNKKSYYFESGKRKLIDFYIKKDISFDNR